jgi:hypothetical protein
VLPGDDEDHLCGLGIFVDFDGGDDIVGDGIANIFDL